MIRIYFRFHLFVSSSHINQEKDNSITLCIVNNIGICLNNMTRTIIESERHRNSRIQVRGLPRCWKIPARPSSLLSARRVASGIASGVASSAESPLGDSRPSRSTAFPPTLPSPLRKNSGLHSVKRQPIRVYGQWDQTPSLTPLTPQCPFFTQPPVSACLRVFMRMWTSSPPNFISCLVFALDDVWGCFFRDDARALSASDVRFLGITARKTIIYPTRAAQFRFSAPRS